MEPGDLFVREDGRDGICAAYNRILQQAQDTPECDGVVLIHDDVEIGEDARSVLAAALATESVGVVGVAGGSDLFGGQWFTSTHQAGYANDSTGRHVLGPPEADVDVVDGLLLAISRAAFSDIRFDEVGLPAFHGYDTDYCLRVRDRGLRVRVAALDYTHHDKGGVGDEAAFHAAQDHLRAQWHPRWIRTPTPREERREEWRQGVAPWQLRRKRAIRKVKAIRRRLSVSYLRDGR